MMRDYAADAKQTSRPFALVVSWASPHFPNYVPEPFASMYDPAKIPQWPSFGDRFTNKPYANERSRDAWGVTGVPWSEWSRIAARYYGIVSHVDGQIGRVIAEVDRLGIGNDTVVIYTSDHGDMTGAHGLFNKGGVPYEEIYHVPLIVRLPANARAGTEVRALVRNMDLMPTIVELAGETPASDLHARSLLPLMRGAATPWYEDLMFEFHGDIVGLYESRILRTDRYEFAYSVADRNELYDLEKDPFEITNVYGDPGYRDVRTTLSKRLLAWMAQTKDPTIKPARVVLG